MSRPEKLAILQDFSQLFNYELSCIPYDEIEVEDTKKAESIAADYYRRLGFQVYHSRTNNGYRCIGVEFYWKEFASRLTDSDKEIISTLKKILTHSELEELANIIKDKSGTPDLLLIKDGKISFVEIKFNYETVKFSTVEFYIKYSAKWPISILRVIKR
jgi:hypothetical protein